MTTLILHYYPKSVRKGISYTLMAHPRIRQCIPVTITSDNVLDTHSEFPTFKKPMDKASMTLLDNVES